MLQQLVQHLSSCSVIQRISNSIGGVKGEGGLENRRKSVEVTGKGDGPEMKSKLFVQPDGDGVKRVQQTKWGTGAAATWRVSHRYLCVCVSLCVCVCVLTCHCSVVCYFEWGTRNLHGKARARVNLSSLALS